MVDRDSIILAFRKLLAPRPVIWVFTDLKGWWSDIAEVPETYQVIVGLSLDLFEDIRYEILAKTGKELGEFVEIRFSNEFTCIEDPRPPQELLRHVKHAITITPQPL